MSIARAAIGTLLKRGDGGVGAGVRAFKTIGTGNQMLKIEALTPGTAGNARTFGIIVGGVSTAYSQTISPTAVVINSATDGAGLATTTVSQAIVNLYADATFRANYLASTTGNGSGILLAGAVGTFAGGTAGGEIFTLIPGVLDIGGPSRTSDLIDVTSHDSLLRYREFILGLRDGGSITGELNYKSSNAQHQGLNDDFENGVLRNFQVLYTDGTLYEFSAFVSSFEFTSAIDAQYKASFELKITGPVTITPGAA